MPSCSADGMVVSYRVYKNDLPYVDIQYDP